jgi:hypothetical protein
MNCIKDDIIQKYIDGETTPSELLLVENHIAVCKKCAAKIENQRKLAALLKKAINPSEKDSIQIPDFLVPSKTIKNISSPNIRLFYIIAAASILLFLFVIRPKNETASQKENSIELGYTLEVDANRPVSKLPMVISIIDSQGNVSEYFVK